MHRGSGGGWSLAAINPSVLGLPGMLGSWASVLIPDGITGMNPGAQEAVAVMQTGLSTIGVL